MNEKIIADLEEKLELEKSLKHDYQKKVEELEKIIQDLTHGEIVAKSEYDKLLKKYEDSKQKNENFVQLIKNRSQIKNETNKNHNERGAGRKSTLTDEQIKKMQELHEQGLSYSKIAKEVNLSKAYVYKLIKKQ